MTNVFLILINLLALSLGGQIWQAIKSSYKSKGLKFSIRTALGLGILSFSITAGANTFIMAVANA